MTRLIDIVKLEIRGGVDYDYTLEVMKLFPPSIELKLDIEDFHDENIGAEAFIRLLSYYKITEVTLRRCIIFNNSSIHFFIAPPKILKAYFTEMKIQRADVVLNCETLKLINCKINMKNVCEMFFAKVKKARIENLEIKDNFLYMFSSNLTELIVKCPIKLAP